MLKCREHVVINILTRLSFKEAGRASVLARGWRYLWRFAFRILVFDQEETATGKVMEKEKLESRAACRTLHGARRGALPVCHSRCTRTRAGALSSGMWCSRRGRPGSCA